MEVEPAAEETGPSEIIEPLEQPDMGMVFPWWVILVVVVLAMCAAVAICFGIKDDEEEKRNRKKLEKKVPVTKELPITGAEPKKSEMDEKKTDTYFTYGPSVK